MLIWLLVLTLALKNIERLSLLIVVVLGVAADSSKVSPTQISNQLMPTLPPSFPLLPNIACILNFFWISISNFQFWFEMRSEIQSRSRENKSQSYYYFIFSFIGMLNTAALRLLCTLYSYIYHNL